MDETVSTLAPLPAPPPTRGALYLRFAMLAALLALAVVAWRVLFHTSLGEQLRHRDTVHAWVHAHRLIAPAILFAAYVVCATLMLPVWWLQIIAGFSFGLFYGALLCVAGSVCGATTSLHVSRWLVGDWFRARYESRMTRLRAFDEKLGHNGLLVVMGVRLCHMLPFGLSNYLFGLTSITTREVLIGTALGNLPAITIYVAAGVYGWTLMHNWRFWVILGGINALLLVPLVLRYARPEWFRKIGVE